MDVARVLREWLEVEKKPWPLDDDEYRRWWGYDPRNDVQSLLEQLEAARKREDEAVDYSEQVETERDRLKEQLEAIVEATRFKEGEDCWCAFRQVDDLDWHSPRCERVREVLSVSFPATEGGGARREFDPSDSPSVLDPSIDVEGAEAGWTGAPDPASSPEVEEKRCQ